MAAEATFDPQPAERVYRRRFVDRGRRTVAVTVALGLLGTLLVSVLPGLKFVYRSDEAHVAIETAAFLAPALAALLFAGRALRGRSRTDLLLAASLALLATTNFFFSVIPAIFDQDPGRFATWAPASGRLLGAIGFALAALLPERRLAHPRRELARVMVGVAVVAGLIAILAALFAGDLPRGIDPDLSPETANRPRIVGHPVVLGLQLVSVFLYAAATVGFLRRSERERDALFLWVALAAALTALARLNYFLFPSLYSEWVYVGDVFRLGGYLALLVGVSRELLSYQREAADAAVFEERRRLARELHDGLAQELAFIRSEGARLSGTTDRSVMRMATAAERALGEARMAISALTTPIDEPLDVTLRRAAEAVALRVGAAVEVECVGRPQPTTAARQALERIVREATGNAVRHGQAKLVRVEIHADGQLRVKVCDDGRGFDTSRPAKRDSFGMISMRERAEAMEGALSVTSEPAAGTTIEVVMPNGGSEPARGRRR
jgi:signal transduction histidine kinase